jgi:3-oxoacyl-[acyl-carrier protein] reductase
MARLRNKVALVTGSSRGIGAAIARLFARESAKVVVHARDLQALSEVRAESIMQRVLSGQSDHARRE